MYFQSDTPGNKGIPRVFCRFTHHFFAIKHHSIFPKSADRSRERRKHASLLIIPTSHYAESLYLRVENRP